MTISEKIEILNLLGELVLTYGAETYRVEDTMNRVAKALEINDFSSFVIPTGIFINYSDENKARQMYINRIYNNNINLERLDAANDLARKLTNKTITDYNEVMEQITAIHKIDTYPHYIKILTPSLVGSFFVLMLGGGFIECLVALFISCLLLFTLQRIKVNFFLQNLIGGALIALFAAIAVYILNRCNITINRDVTIIGPIMLLVPGVAITVGVKDIISGELVSGGARITEALFTSIAIAFGVGMVLYAGF